MRNMWETAHASRRSCHESSVSRIVSIFFVHCEMRHATTGENTSRGIRRIMSHLMCLCWCGGEAIQDQTTWRCASERPTGSDSSRLGGLRRETRKRSKRTKRNTKMNIMMARKKVTVNNNQNMHRDRGANRETNHSLTAVWKRRCVLE